METDVSTEDKRKMAQEQAFENRELGINEQQKWVAQMGQTLAGNPGPLVGGGIGFPGMIGGNVVQPAAAGTAEIAKLLMNQPPQGTAESAEAQPAREPFEERVRKLKYMLDNGMITQQQYDDKINQIMSEI